MEIVTITFNSQGGAYVAPMMVEKGAPFYSPATPTRNGYSFRDWRTQPDGGVIVSDGTLIYSDMTLYAYWAARSYSIQVVNAGGRFSYSISPNPPHTGETVRIIITPNSQYYVETYSCKTTAGVSVPMEPIGTQDIYVIDPMPPSNLIATFKCVYDGD